MKQSNITTKNQLLKNKPTSKKLLKQVLFTVAYYNVLGYYPTGFFIWKNLIDIKGEGTKSSLSEIICTLKTLRANNKIVDKNGIYKISYQLVEFSSQSRRREMLGWYKQQIQKNKISTEKIKRAKKWDKASKWVPYLRGLFLTGTLAMKRGGINSDWDVLVVLKRDRIWLGRLILTTWFHLVGKRRYGKKVMDRFCLNQFIVESNLKLEEKNEFIGNEILLSRELLKNNKLKEKFVKKNYDWIKALKPNFKLRESFLEKQKNGVMQRVQKKIELILEVTGLAEIMNTFSKKIMIRKIVNNPKTYASEADIRYSDFFLVFLPYPQRKKIKQRTFELLDCLTRVE